MISRFFIIGFLIGTLTVRAQQDSLYTKIAHLDSIVFSAFNSRNIDLFQSMFDENLEFYHDKGGLTGYAHTVEFIKEVAKPGNDLKRELVKGSLKIYPIPGYGAMEIGAHRFCHTENGKADCGTFQFVHVWQYKDHKWKITRVISYDHVSPAYANERKAIKLSLSVLNKYRGKYKGTQTGEVHVTSGPESLTLSIADKEYLIYPATESLFFSTDRDLTFEFLNTGTTNARIIVRENNKIAEELKFIK